LLKNIGLLDVDYATIIKIIFHNEYRQLEAKNIGVPVLGDNSYQLLPLDLDDIMGLVHKEVQAHHDTFRGHHVIDLLSQQS
jgi:hypothetical protein